MKAFCNYGANNMVVFSSTKSVASQFSKVLCFDNAQSNKLESIRDVLEIWNQYLKDGYNPDSCLTVSEHLAAFEVSFPFGIYTTSKPGNME